MHTVGKELLNRGEKARADSQRASRPAQAQFDARRSGRGRSEIVVSSPVPNGGSGGYTRAHHLICRDGGSRLPFVRRSDSAALQIAQLQQRGGTSADPISGGPGGAIEFHVDQVPRTAHLEAIWNDNYLPDDSPGAEPGSIRAASGPDVKKIIDDMRKANVLTSKSSPF